MKEIQFPCFKLYNNGNAIDAHTIN